VGENPENQDPFIVLEYVAGETLNRVLAREKKLPLATCLQLAIEIAEALDYAHSQGVTHRDVKPANILITRDGHAKIADFGIAKLNLAHFTLPGRVLGTPAYMAPEQLSGEGADGRSDLFSLGVILYAMVTGHSPFQGNSATTVCFKVANREPVAASALDMTLPPDLDAIIGRAMAKNPEERYQRGAELAADLRQLQQYKTGSTTTSVQRVAATSTRSTAKRTATAATSAVPPAAAVAQAEKVVRHILFKAPIRDLVLGAATVVMLVVLAVQSKVLVSSPKATSVPVSTANNAPVASTAAPQSVEPPSPGTPVQMAPVHPAPRKSRAKVPQNPDKPIVVPLSTVDISVQHQFKDATLLVWVDDKLVLTRPLHGGVQKKLVVFSGTRGVESETLQVPAGQHVLRFKAQSTDQTVDLSKTVSAEFVGGDTKTLQITFDKHNTVMHLAWQ
jgi:serine/threonine protein kinase